ncbi:hypothetical protein [Leptolyngbya sp. FACHB-261]|uniref:hypothetical protein n=1 Tax=Leptolyngbya sp. FACHB-261 TaxID=2692806 RepID=UPI001688F5E9|nr:hypothetical protein [Leptolyngbya sp. FACHB-261]
MLDQLEEALTAQLRREHYVTSKPHNPAARPFFLPSILPSVSCDTMMHQHHRLIPPAHP